MAIEILTGSDVPTLLARAQQTLGDDAVVMSVRRILDGRRMGFEMVAADPATAAEHRRRDAARNSAPGAFGAIGAAALLEPEGAAGAAAGRATYSPPRSFRPSPEAGPGFWDLGRAPGNEARESRESAAPARSEKPARENARRAWPFGAKKKKDAVAKAPVRRPYVVALVGPTGAGKTTTLAKLANHPQAFGGRRAGILGLDTYRIAGIEQARQYAELSGASFEVAYESRELAPAMLRMKDREVVLVDTPGRGPRAAADLRDAQALLSELRPDEVHLVMPAGLQRSLARAILTAHLPFGVTHLLVTKLDEFPDERTLFELAREFGLPMRWITDGQEVPRHLQLAPESPGAGRAAGAAHDRRFAEVA